MYLELGLNTFGFFNVCHVSGADLAVKAHRDLEMAEVGLRSE